MSSNSLNKREGFVFMNFKVPVFVNKTNGQVSVNLPKKKMKKLYDGDFSNVKEVKISLWKPVN